MYCISRSSQQSNCNILDGTVIRGNGCAQFVENNYNRLCITILLHLDTLNTCQKVNAGWPLNGCGKRTFTPLNLVIVRGIV